jgi:RNA polymerase subunit RPABC4/transcription elongation factor Spt4
MVGVISDRMAPVGRKTNTFLGPLNNPEVIEDLIIEDKLDICSTDRMSQDWSGYVVIFINESSLGRSPQIEIKITEDFTTAEYAV